MDDKNSGPVGFVVAKILSVWAAIGLTTWSEAAAFVAFLYSCALLYEWISKKWKASRAPVVVDCEVCNGKPPTR